jgi:hypothetical protein
MDGAFVQPDTRQTTIVAKPAAKRIARLGHLASASRMGRFKIIPAFKSISHLAATLTRFASSFGVWKARECRWSDPPQ